MFDGMYKIPIKKSTMAERKEMADNLSITAQRIMDVVEHLEPHEQDAAMELAATLLAADRQRVNLDAMSNVSKQFAGIIGTNAAPHEQRKGPSWVQDAIDEIEKTGKKEDL